MESHPNISIGRLAIGIALFVVIGTPIVAYLWETLNEVMSGFFDPIRLVISVPLLIAFLLLLRYLARFVQGWEAQRAD